MQEKTLHNFWQWIKPQKKLYTVNGHPLVILNPGELNRYQGPDFINAEISINGTVYIGDVEIHLKTSGWINHGHHLDAWYQKVVLHVVWENDRNPDITEVHYPPHTLELKEFYTRPQLIHSSELPDPELLKQLATAKLNRKTNFFSVTNLTEQQFYFQLFLTLWQACGYPHNQGPFSLFGHWVFPFVKNNHHYFPKKSVTPLLFYWLRGANLWSRFEKMEIYSHFEPFLSKAPPKVTCFSPHISWNFGGIHPVNHPVLKIWEFIMLLTGINLPELLSQIIQVLVSRQNPSQLLQELEKLFILPEPVNGVKHWHTVRRVTEWLMTDAIPLSMAYFDYRQEHGMVCYLQNLFYELPPGYSYGSNNIKANFVNAWQYQGLREWIQKRRRG